MNESLLQPCLFLRRSRGFTLIELMMVLIVLAVMAGMATISFRNDPLAQLEREQLRLQSLLNFAADEAVLQGELLGLSVDGRSYQLVFFESNAQVWKKNEGRYFSTQLLPESINITITLDGDRLTEQEQQQIALMSQASGVEQIVPAILFLASGEITPFTLTLQHMLAAKPLQLSSDGLSGIRAD